LSSSIWPSGSIQLFGRINKASDDRTVAEYQEKFLALLGHIEALSIAQQVSIFTASLIDLLKIDVELHNPQDLDTAMSLARAHELRAKIAAAGSIEASSSEKSPMPVGQLQGMPFDWFSSSWDGRSLRRLTAAEMAETREKGLCFNYDEKFSRGHCCQRLFYLEVIDDAEEQDPP
jgi:hypothetical protein